VGKEEMETPPEGCDKDLFPEKKGGRANFYIRDVKRLNPWERYLSDPDDFLPPVSL
jgi:hypothetical protein